MSPPAPEAAPPPATRPAALEATPTLNTLIVGAIQIDQLDEAGPGDANLVVGPDRADGTASVDRPFGATGPFIDWDDLGDDLANHRHLDLDSPSGKDPTAFPRSTACVGEAQVLSKMDLTYLASANSTEYAYLGVQRAGNNGDAGYYWIFTRKPPLLNVGEAPCHADEAHMAFDISGPGPAGEGDVLVLGHFHPSGEPLVRVFLARESRDNVDAVAAINYLDTTLWVEDPTRVAAAAVNTTPTGPGAFGAAGVKTTPSGDLPEETFAEAALSIDTFTGDSVCGKSFYGTVITRSSGSGGTTPDLKDTSTPALFNFGTTTVTPTITPTCGTSVTVSAAVVAPDGEPAENPVCTWTFSNGTTFDGCDGTVDLGVAGDYTAQVTVTDGLIGCSTSSAELSFHVSSPISVSAALAPGCDGEVAFDATLSGVDPSAVDFAWTFSSDGGDHQTAAGASGTFVGAPGEMYLGEVVVTYLRDDGLTCEATAIDKTVPRPSLTAVANVGATCDLELTYGVTDVSGALGAVTCAWTFDGGGTSSACDGTLRVGGAGSYGGSVVLTDVVTGCTGAASAAPATLYDPIGVGATLDDGCDATVHYSGVVTGGYADGREIVWTFSPAGASPATSSALSGTFSGVALTTYTGVLKATDTRPDGLVCTGSDADTGVALAPLTIAPALSPRCVQAFDYAAGAITGTDGGALATPSCLWRFGDGTESTACAGTHETAPGTYTGYLTVTDPGTGCSVSGETDAVDVWAPLAASVVLSPETCTPSFGYAATVTGGSTAGVYYAWTFSPSDASPAASSAPSGVVDGSELTTYTAELVVTDLRPDLKGCVAKASATTDTVAITRATAALTPTCGQGFDYAVTSATGADGQPIAAPGCAWSFSDGKSESTCSGNHEVVEAAAGYGGTVVVTDPASGCTAAADGGSVDAWAPLEATAELTARCDEAFDFAGGARGGSPAGVSWSWTFAPDSAVPAASSAQSGTAGGVADVTYTGVLEIVDLRSDGPDCRATASDVATPRAPLAVSLTPSAASASCPGLASDAVVYDATPSGGSGSYTFTWLSPTDCAGSSCAYDPPDDVFCVTQTFQVVLSDDEGLCDPATSELETYRKLTQIDISDE
ncbi:MAG: hypothetical protein EP329_25090 [Deltaproteobacteria bacterium]|nr:MAG: hypothetical protein EP329_25090 [Deltaproteobacteria bacterium]